MFLIACLNLFLLCTVVHDLISCLVKERMNSFVFVSSSLFFETMTSTVGLGYMVSPRAFWFQVGSFEVHARSGIWSASFSRSLVFLDTYRLNLQALRLRLMNDCSSPKNPKQTSIWNLPLHPRQCIMLKRHYEGVVLWKGVLTFATPEKIPLVTVLSISLRYTSFTNVAFLSSVRTVNRHSPNSHQWVQQIFPSRYRRKKGHFLKWDSLSTRWVIELPLKLGNSSRAGVRGSCYSLFFAAVFLFSSNFSLFV